MSNLTRSIALLRFYRLGKDAVKPIVLNTLVRDGYIDSLTGYYFLSDKGMAEVNGFVASMPKPRFTDMASDRSH